MSVEGLPSSQGPTLLPNGARYLLFQRLLESRIRVLNSGQYLFILLLLLLSLLLLLLLLLSTNLKTLVVELNSQKHRQPSPPEDAKYWVLPRTYGQNCNQSTKRKRISDNAAQKNINTDVLQYTTQPFKSNDFPSADYILLLRYKEGMIFLLSVY